MRTGRKWWFWGMWDVPPCGRDRLCGLRRLPPRPLRGGWRASPGWLEGPGCNLAARWDDLVGSGGRRRRGAAVSAFRVWLGWAPAMCEGVRGGVRRGEQFAWAAFRGRGVWVLGLGGVCRGRVWVTGQGGVGRGLWGSWRLCVYCRVWRAVRLVRRGGLWRACVGDWAGLGGPCCGARGCAQWWVCVGHWVWNGEGEAGGVGLGLRALCQCMCLLAAARSCGVV